MRWIQNCLAAALVFILHSACVAGSDDGYLLKLKVKGLPKDSSCFLANHFGDKFYIQDTAKPDAQGQLQFSGKTKLKPGIYLLVLPKKKFGFDFLIDNNQHFSLETDTADFIKHMKIKGSDENKSFYEYLNYIAEKQKEMEPLLAELKKVKDSKDSSERIRRKMTAIDQQVKDYKASYVKRNPKSLQAQIFKAMTDVEVPPTPMLPNKNRPDSSFPYRYQRAHYWDNYDFSDERLLRSPILYNKMKNFLDNMTYPIPDSLNAAADVIVEKAKANKEVFQYVVSWITVTYESSQILGMDAVFAHMGEKYYMTKQAYWVDSAQLVKISNRVMTIKPLLIGKYAPNLTLKDSNLNEVTLYDTRAKFTILYFWDYGCSHCKKVTPKLLEWYEKNKSKGIQVFAVGTETNAEEWKKYIRQNKLDWINVYDPQYSTGFKKTYDIYSTPKMFILDENKKIIANKQLEVDQLDGFIEHMINQQVIDKTKSH